MSELQRRSEALLRSKGYLTASVERRKRFPAKGKLSCRACGHIPQIDIAQDLWNVFDLVAIKPDGKWQSESRVVFVQVTDSTSHSKRRNKILASAEAKLCILAGCRVLVQSWKKRDNRWQSQDEWITLDQFAKGLPNTVEEFYEETRKAKLPDLPPGSTLPLSNMLADDEIPF